MLPSENSRFITVDSWVTKPFKRGAERSMPYTVWPIWTYFVLSGNAFQLITVTVIYFKKNWNNSGWGSLHLWQYVHSASLQTLLDAVQPQDLAELLSDLSTAPPPSHESVVLWSQFVSPESDFILFLKHKLKPIHFSMILNGDLSMCLYIFTWEYVSLN